MNAPPKIYYTTEQEYRGHFERVYCQQPITTFDNIRVRFRESDFDHCMFESSKRNTVKETFSRKRAERIDWIKATLADPLADMRQGWDKRRKRIAPERRVAIAHEEFVVIIAISKPKRGGYIADFVTAFLAENNILKIKAMPRWVGI